MFFHQEFGIDLGTDTIKIYDKKENSITIEKNLIAVRGGTEVLSVGDEAWRMTGRVAADTKVCSPVEAGRISDVWYAEAIIHSLLFRQKHYIGYRPSIYFAVPPDMTEIERRAYASIARRGRLRNCETYLVEKPIADALALGLPIIKAKGTMMISMGAFSTDLSAIADSHVILNNSVPVGGRSIDEAIVAAVRKRNRLQISLNRAEELKKLFAGTAGEAAAAGIMTEGIDVNTGLPRDGYITASTVQTVVNRLVDELTEALVHFLERIPPQILNAAAKDGIYLSGGCSRIRGIADTLRQRLNMNIHLSGLYEACTISGIREVISYTGANKMAFAPMQKKTASRTIAHR